MECVCIVKISAMKKIRCIMFLLMLCLASITCGAAKTAYGVNFVYAGGKLYCLKSFNVNSLGLLTKALSVEKNPLMPYNYLCREMLWVPSDSIKSHPESKDSLSVSVRFFHEEDGKVYEYTETFVLNFKEVFIYEGNAKKDDVLPRFHVADNDYNRNVLLSFKHEVADLVARHPKSEKRIPLAELMKKGGKKAAMRALNKLPYDSIMYWRSPNMFDPIVLSPLCDTVDIKSNEDLLLLAPMTKIELGCSRLGSTTSVEKSIKGELCLFATDDELLYVTRYARNKGYGKKKKLEFVSFPFLNFLDQAAFDSTQRSITHDIANLKISAYFHDAKLHKLDFSAHIMIRDVSYDPDEGAAGTIYLPYSNEVKKNLEIIKEHLSEVYELPDFDMKRFTGKIMLSSLTNPNKSIMLVVKRGQVKDSILMGK